MMRPPLAAVVALVCILQTPESQAFTPVSTKTAFSARRSPRQFLYLGEDSDQATVPNNNKRGEKKQSDLVTPPTSLGTDDSWAAALELKTEMGLRDLDALFQTIEEEGPSLADVEPKAEAFHRAMLKARLEMEKKAADDGVSSVGAVKETLSPVDVQFEQISQNLDTALDDIETEIETIDIVVASPPLVETKESKEEVDVMEGRLAHFDNGDDDDGDDGDDDDTDETEEQTPSDVKATVLPEQRAILPPVASRKTYSISAEAKDSTLADAPKTKEAIKASVADEVVPKQDEVADAVAAAVAAVENASLTADSPPTKVPAATKATTVESTIKVPSPPKEAPPVSSSRASSPDPIADDTEQEDQVPFWTAFADPYTRVMDTFKPEQSIAELKEKDESVILEAAASHLAKAAGGVGKAVLLTFGASFKAATSPDVAESAREASSCVSQAVESISDAFSSNDGDEKSDASSASDDASKAAKELKTDAFLELVKGFRATTTSFGSVGATFVRSFGRTQQSSDAFEAVAETTKECASFLTCIVAFGAKKSGRVIETEEEVVTKETARMTKEEKDYSAVGTNPRASIPNLGPNHGERPQAFNVARAEEVTAETAEMDSEEKVQVRETMRAEVTNPNPLKSLLDLGAKQGERAQEYFVALKEDAMARSTVTSKEDLEEGNSTGATIPLASVLNFGTEQGEQAQDYFAAIRQDIAAKLAGKAKNDVVDEYPATETNPLATVLEQGERAQDYLVDMTAKFRAKSNDKKMAADEDVETKKDAIASMMALATKQSERALGLAATLKENVMTNLAGMPKKEDAKEPIAVEKKTKMSLEDTIMLMQIETNKSKKNRKKTGLGDGTVLFFAKKPE